MLYVFRHSGLCKTIFITVVIEKFLQIHLEPLTIGDNGHQLPCRFYDIPGLDDVETLKKDRIIKMINGKLKIDVEVKTYMYHFSMKKMTLFQKTCKKIDIKTTV